MTTLNVSCTVSNCFFHAKGNICGAEKIEIDMNQQTSGSEHTEFATDFDMPTILYANHSTDTCCKTFISKAEKQKQNQ